MFTPSTEDQVLRDPDCEILTGLGNMQRRRLEARGVFPLRFKLCPDSGPFGAVGWWKSEVLEYLHQRAATRMKVGGGGK